MNFPHVLTCKFPIAENINFINLECRKEKIQLHAVAAKQKSCRKSVNDLNVKLRLQTSIEGESLKEKLKMSKRKKELFFHIIDEDEIYQPKKSSHKL